MEALEIALCVTQIERWTAAISRGCVSLRLHGA